MFQDNCILQAQLKEQKQKFDKNLEASNKEIELHKTLAKDAWLKFHEVCEKLKSIGESNIVVDSVPNLSVLSSIDNETGFYSELSKLKTQNQSLLHDIEKARKECLVYKEDVEQIHKECLEHKRAYYVLTEGYGRLEGSDKDIMHERVKQNFLQLITKIYKYTKKV